MITLLLKFKTTVIVLYSRQLSLNFYKDVLEIKITTIATVFLKLKDNYFFKEFSSLVFYK